MTGNERHSRPARNAGRPPYTRPMQSDYAPESPLRFATRVLVRLRHAIMVDVFFISTLVAYIKLSSVAEVEFGSAFYLMFALSVILIRTSVSIPQHWVYYKIHASQEMQVPGRIRRPGRCRFFPGRKARWTSFCAPWIQTP